ncbi:MAG: hypothetical protein IPK66_03925 [Rhodospirillales bacterium]|nr:hypothetical protein [Rhodospirillales bacterium]
MNLRGRMRLPRMTAIATSACILLSATSLAHADPVRLDVLPGADRARLTMTWPVPVGFKAETQDRQLTVRFERPIEADLSAVRGIGTFTSVPTVGEDGRALTFLLRRGVTVLAVPADQAVILEFAKLGGAASEADPQPRADASPGPPPAVPVRTGQHRGFSRVVFDWPGPVGYTVIRTPDGATITFDAPATINARAFFRRYLTYIRGGTAETTEKQTTVTLVLPEGATLRDFREKRKVVVDVLAPSPTAQKAPVEAAQEVPRSAPLPSVSTIPTPVIQTPVIQTPVLTRPPQTSLTPIPSALSPESPPLPPPTAPAQSVPAAIRPPEAGPVALRFEWEQTVAAAVFRRGTSLWCIFDQPSSQNVALLRARAGSAASAVEQQPNDRATVLRIIPAPGIDARIERDGRAWVLRLGTQGAGDSAPIIPAPDLGPPLGPRLMLPVAGAGTPIALADPQTSDRLVVVPVTPPGARLERAYAYPQFRLLPTLQGVVVAPLIDTLRVRALREGVEVRSVDGLAISPVSEAAQAASRLAPVVPPRRQLSAGDWLGGVGDSFVERRRTLEHAVVDSTGSERERSRLKLVQFLLGRRFAAEALGELALAAEERPTIVADPDFLLLRGAARLMAGRTGEARGDLARARAANNDETALWSIAARPDGEDPGDLSNLPQWTEIARSYPQPLRPPLLLALADAAIAAGKDPEAKSLLEIAKNETSSPEDRSRLALLDGLRLEKAGNVKDALARFEEAAVVDPRRGRVTAELARLDLLRKDGTLPPQQEVQALDQLRFTWRGDELEFRVLDRLGRAQLAAGDYRDGLQTLKRAVSNFPKAPGAADVTQEMSRTFETLYLGGGADAMPPITALGLYDEFKELTPPGDKGNEIVRRLAERLVAVDLLDRAATMIESLLTPSATPLAKATDGARLAEIKLLDGDSNAALDALRRTATIGLPGALEDRRRRAQAQALAGLGKTDEALSLIASDDGREADLLRAKLYRNRGDWPRAAESIRRVVDAARSDPGKPLDDRQARDVLDLAVALTLAGNDPQLTKLNGDYRSAMSATPLRDAFRLLAGTVPPPDADAKALAALVENAMAFRRSLTPPVGSPAPGAPPSSR